MVVTLFLVLILAFFFVKDGPRFIPWLHGVSGGRAGRHLEEVLGRMWDTLGGFHPHAGPRQPHRRGLHRRGTADPRGATRPVLAILTFIGGFVPIVGAFVAGALAVLVALVANGLTTALIVLAIIIAVQQIEGNVLQPVLQSKSMKLHAVVVLLAVTAGSSLFGIVGAFLAVPVAAVGAVVIRYLGEQIDERLQEDALLDAADATAGGAVTPLIGEPTTDEPSPIAEPAPNPNLPGRRSSRQSSPTWTRSGRATRAAGSGSAGASRPHADDADHAPARPQLVEHAHHQVQGVGVQRAEPLVDEHRVEHDATRFGGHDVREPERERQGCEERLAARQGLRGADHAGVVVADVEPESPAAAVGARLVRVHELVSAGGHAAQPHRRRQRDLLEPRGQHVRAQRHLA